MAEGNRALKPGTGLSGTQKTVWFLIGFGGWFIVHIAFGSVAGWLISNSNPTVQQIALLLSVLLFVANVAALIVLAFFPRGQWAAFGMLAAIATVLCIVLVLGGTVAAICFGLVRSGGL